MDKNTEGIVSLIERTDVGERPELARQAKRAFIDYAAALLAARDEPAVRRVARLVASRQGDVPMLGQTARATAEHAAFFQGFCSHYLDYDDAQANIAGHFSTVLFSALLASVRPDDSALGFLNAYVAGAELEGLLGRRLNPRHKLQGWHSTGTLGAIGAAAAVGKLRGLRGRRLARLLSLGATQSAGMGFEAGSEAKPLHAGFAARNAVFACALVQEAGLTASESPFHEENGWLRTIGNAALDLPAMEGDWLNPGQILVPGLWMKRHHYCSAAICAAAACEAIYRQGYPLEKLERVTFHFAPGSDKALHYAGPRTGKEGQFSVEYVAWQILSGGDVDDALFREAHVPQEFRQALPKFRRANDLPPLMPSERATKVTAIAADGRILEYDIRDPAGSPGRPFTAEELRAKLSRAADAAFADALLEAVEKWPDVPMAEALDVLYALHADEEKGV